MVNMEKCEECVHFYKTMVGKDGRGCNPYPYCHLYEDKGESPRVFTRECFERRKKAKANKKSNVVIVQKFPCEKHNRIVRFEKFCGSLYFFVQDGDSKHYLTQHELIELADSLRRAIKEHGCDFGEEINDFANSFCGT